MHREMLRPPKSSLGHFQKKEADGRPVYWLRKIAARSNTELEHYPTECDISLPMHAGVESGLLWRSIPKSHNRRRSIRTSLLPEKKLWTWLKKRPWSLSPRVTRLPGTQGVQNCN